MENVVVIVIQDFLDAYVTYQLKKLKNGNNH